MMSDERGSRAYCDVAIPHTRLDELTYWFDPDSLGKLAPGDCVRVPLRGKPVKGLVMCLRDKSPVRRPLPVEKVVERELVGPELMKLILWVRGYYWARLGEVLSLALPRGICGYKPRKTDSEARGEVLALRTVSPSAVSAGVVFDRFKVYFSGRGQDRLELATSFIRSARKHGPVLVLLPEVELKDWLPGLCGVFGPDIAEYHAGLRESQRKQVWRRIRAGKHGVVVGVRSVVFAPVEKLGGVVVLDGHDKVYKEERRPRFHARDTAIARAGMAGCPVLLCDRTPSAETWLNLKTGTYSCLEKPGAGSGRSGAFVVDMRRHRDELFSARLVRELRQVQDRGTAILYVNRRGVSRHVVCQECGKVLECPECGIPLLLTVDKTVSCRYCGQIRAAPEACPECRGTRFRFRAPGVDMVAREVNHRFPGMQVLRITGDSVAQSATGNGKAIVGTRALFSQRWPDDTRLVAAVCFDYDLILPDFRSRERAFQRLFEMERRARMLGARLVVQTWRPDDPAVRSGVSQDPAGFLDQELELRQELEFPPFKRLVLIEFHGTSEAKVRRHAGWVGLLVNRVPGVEAIGPVAVRGKTGIVWRLLVKTARNRQLDQVLDRTKLEARGIRTRIDVDPLEIV